MHRITPAQFLMTTQAPTFSVGRHGFTLDREFGVRVLTHPKLRIPADIAAIVIDASRARYVADESVAGVDDPRGRDFSMHGAASMVADMRRLGGVRHHEAWRS